MRLLIAASVDDFPDPVGPSSSTRSDTAVTERWVCIGARARRGGAPIPRSLPNRRQSAAGNQVPCVLPAGAPGGAADGGAAPRNLFVTPLATRAPVPPPGGVP